MLHAREPGQQGIRIGNRPLELLFGQRAKAGIRYRETEGYAMNMRAALSKVFLP